MFILGLTGSIGMGKTTCATMFRELGVPVHDSDAVVHAALAPGGKASDQVAQGFPKAIKDGAVDRQTLAKEVFADGARLRALEAILHPIVAASAVGFLRRHAFAGARLVVLDIPLLFETGARDRVDAVLVVSAPASIQARRVLSRPGMTAAQYQRIRDTQIPDKRKKQAADFVISTGSNKAHTFASIAQLTEYLRAENGRAWAPGYAARHFGQTKMRAKD